MKKTILATRVGSYIEKSVRMLIKSLDISISEYLRRLIMQDLDSRNLFDKELREVIESFDEEDLHHRKARSRFISYPPKEISVEDL